jgi:hypothetical protein
LYFFPNRPGVFPSPNPYPNDLEPPGDSSQLEKNRQPFLFGKFSGTALSFYGVGKRYGHLGALSRGILKISGDFSRMGEGVFRDKDRQF